ncbi:hypothetical protein OPV22_022505 [Ensete ventricosum]|uniref:Uncharacterized protein n=1 Tax=Ensete ventricosum TaxID=4639 RepID=A0AAV8QQ03_ENSVE|nr:hypothetical protein OPV22_022505 [Ensete ventricosum]RWW16334.1 hypothetical protein GW17_00019798 [Ensete ventricosum]
MRTGGNQDGPTAVRRGLNRPPPRAAPSLIPTTSFLASPPSSQPSYPSPTAPVTSGAVPTNTDLRHSPVILLARPRGRSWREGGPSQARSRRWWLPVEILRQHMGRITEVGRLPQFEQTIGPLWADPPRLWS